MACFKRNVTFKCEHTHTHTQRGAASTHTHVQAAADVSRIPDARLESVSLKNVTVPSFFPARSSTHDCRLRVQINQRCNCIQTAPLQPSSSCTTLSCSRLKPGESPLSIQTWHMTFDTYLSLSFLFFPHLCFRAALLINPFSSEGPALRCFLCFWRLQRTLTVGRGAHG